MPNSSAAVRESMRCAANVVQGGDPEFWKKRLRAAMAKHEIALGILRNRLRWLEQLPNKEG